MEIKCKNCWANHEPGSKKICGCACHRTGREECIPPENITMPSGLTKIDFGVCPDCGRNYKRSEGHKCKPQEPGGKKKTYKERAEYLSGLNSKRREIYLGISEFFGDDEIPVSPTPKNDEEKNIICEKRYCYFSNPCPVHFIPQPLAEEKCLLKGEKCPQNYAHIVECSCPCHKYWGKKAKDWDLKKWFEENYLDGDKIQDGQMIASSECFEAVKEAEAGAVREHDAKWHPIGEQNTMVNNHLIAQARLNAFAEIEKFVDGEMVIENNSLREMYNRALDVVLTFIKDKQK